MDEEKIQHALSERKKFNAAVLGMNSSDSSRLRTAGAQLFHAEEELTIDEYQEYKRRDRD